MWEDLISALNETGFRFAHFAWTSAPSDAAATNLEDYGIYAEDDEITLDANNEHAEAVLEGTIDYFTRDDSGKPKQVIEAALKKYKIPHRIESIQYENDTGYIHYEWVFQAVGPTVE